MVSKPAFACRSCATVPLLFATELDAICTELTRIGWRSYPRKGVGKARWQWDCPACWEPTVHDGSQSTHSRFAHVSGREATCVCWSCELARTAAEASDDEVKF